MKVTCKYCGIVNKPHICPNKPKRSRKSYRDRIDSKSYESKQYRKARRVCINRFNNKCLWSIYIDGKVKEAEEVHHIVEILEDESLSNDLDNLITLTGQAHDKVHELYKINKEKVQKILRLMMKDYLNGKIEFGKYNKEISSLTPPIF